MEKTPTYRKVVGLNVQRARKSGTDLTQEELGKKLSERLGLEKPVLKATVSAIETGDRDVSASELVALAFILGCSVPDLLIPHQENEVQLGDNPKTVPAGDIRQVASPASAELADQLAQMSERLLEADLAKQVKSVTLGTTDIEEA